MVGLMMKSWAHYCSSKFQGGVAITQRSAQMTCMAQARQSSSTLKSERLTTINQQARSRCLAQHAANLLRRHISLPQTTSMCVTLLPLRARTSQSKRSKKSGSTRLKTSSLSPRTSYTSPRLIMYSINGLASEIKCSKGPNSQKSYVSRL